MRKRPQKEVNKVEIEEVKQRTEIKEVAKQEGRKRPEPEAENPKTIKPKPQQELKFMRVGMDATREELKSINEKIVAGEIKFNHYAIDNDKGYRYYLILNK